MQHTYVAPGVDITALRCVAAFLVWMCEPIPGTIRALFLLALWDDQHRRLVASEPWFWESVVEVAGPYVGWLFIAIIAEVFEPSRYLPSLACLRIVTFLRAYWHFGVDATIRPWSTRVRNTWFSRLRIARWFLSRNHGKYANERNVEERHTRVHVTKSYPHNGISSLSKFQNRCRISGSRVPEPELPFQAHGGHCIQPFQVITVSVASIDIQE